jgi:hypothetical protein
MNTTSIVQAVDVAPSVRTLKIEAGGDAWKGTIRPKIRLMGRWLERAGFRPDTRVTVRCIAPGVIELRSADWPVDECEPF